MGPRSAIVVVIGVACAASCAESADVPPIVVLSGGTGGSNRDASSGGNGGKQAGGGSGAGGESGDDGGGASAGQGGGGAGTGGSSGDDGSSGVGGAAGGGASGAGGASDASGGSGGKGGSGGGSGGSGAAGADAGDGSVTHPAISCKKLKDDGLAGGSGPYWIDPDGAGSVAAHQVYCEMVTDSGGWGLVSVSRTDDPDSPPFIGSAYCSSLDTVSACKGRMPVQHVSTTNELLFLGLASGKWAVVGGFSATVDSKIRFITNELLISTTATWTRNGDTTTDPGFGVLRTSGYIVNETAPIRHYVRFGGWWFGHGARAGFEPGGRLIAINYGGTQDFSELPDPAGYSTPFPAEHMALFYR